ncbi:MAG: hypothetical protein WA118_09745 [Carboxydocellales bacterium]
MSISVKTVFRYKKSHSIKYLFLAAYLILILVSFEWFIDKFIPGIVTLSYEASSLFVGVVALLLLICLRNFFFAGNVVIKVTDEIILYEEKGKRLEIPWVEITQVEWVDLFTNAEKVASPMSLLVKSNQGVIEISQTLDRFPKLVQIIKSKVGARFDTTGIPIELKLDK